MIKKIITDGELPEYHEGMLIVKLRESVASMMSFAASSDVGVSALNTSGLAALSAFERGGLIKRVTPLSRPVEEEATALGVRSALGTLTMSADRKYPNDLNARVSVLELERGSDVEQLQNALASDPNVEFVSRVPIRYVEATARKRKSPSSGRSTSAQYISPDEETNAAADEEGAMILAVPPDPSTMWNLRKIQWSQARALPNFKDADQINVAVLDTGVDTLHPDLLGRVTSYVFQHPDIPDASGERDIVGHGTHVSGTIASLINNNVGINGICACRLHVWKIFTDRAIYSLRRNSFEYFVDPTMYRRALADCLDEDIHVINLSIGGPGKPDPQEQQLFKSLLTNGTTVVAAMGNERKQGSPTSFPAAIPGVIAVGATSVDDAVTDFSNRGNHITLCAPGAGIWSTLPTYPGQFGFAAVPGVGGKPVEGKPFPREQNYDAWDGTSMATPHVTAAVALLLAKKGKISPVEVRKQLQKTVDSVPGMGGLPFHPDYGSGRLNLLRLLNT